MTTRELIEKLKEIDSDGNCEVVLNAYADFTPAEEVKKISWFGEDADGEETYVVVEIS